MLDLRQITPIVINDELHDIAVRDLQPAHPQRGDLIANDVARMLDGLDVADQATVFTALIYMCGTKTGALNSRTGIQ